MKIAIYGAGYYGQYIYNEIQSHENSEISVVFWIDNFIKERNICGLPVYTEKDFFVKRKFDEVDAVAVGIENPKIAQKLTLSMLLQGYNKIYLTHLETTEVCSFQAKVPILNEEGRFGTVVKYYKDVKPKLEFMEVLVTHHCNLNCKCCGHFSNIVKEEECLDLDEFESYLIQLKKKVSGIERFQLLGGEPLLHPQLDLFVALSRKYFPNAHIDVVTNGLLIPQIPQRLIDAMVQNNAYFFISQYHPTRKKIGEIISLLEREQINYYITGLMTHFETILTFKEENGEKAYKNRMKCRHCICHSISKGRVYICPTIERLYAVQGFFNIHIEEEELHNSSLNLMSNDVDGWDMLKYFCAPVSICRFCCPEQKEKLWEVGRPQIEDWIAD